MPPALSAAICPNHRASDVEWASYTGWLGVACPSVRSAIWMMRALVASNVLSRREGTTLFVPVNHGTDTGGGKVARALARAVVLRALGIFTEYGEGAASRGRARRIAIHPYERDGVRRDRRGRARGLRLRPRLGKRVLEYHARIRGTNSMLMVA